jgi:hypothetical protein
MSRREKNIYQVEQGHEKAPKAVQEHISGIVPPGAIP